MNYQTMTNTQPVLDLKDRLIKGTEKWRKLSYWQHPSYFGRPRWHYAVLGMILITTLWIWNSHTGHSHAG